MLSLSDDNRKNLAIYSPFYRCLLNFADDKCKTLIYVPNYLSFNAREPLKKIRAFDIDEKFKAKKIIFANLDFSKGSSVGHWDVTVKNPGSDDASIKYNVAGDGNCGLISSIIMLNEVVNHGDENLRSLIGCNFNSQWALKTLKSADINARLSCSHSFIDDVRLGNVGLWLTQDQVHQILMQHPTVQSGLTSGAIKDMTPSSMRSAMDTGDGYVHPGFVGARNTSADNDLDFITNKTLKNEFKNIVINIIYENKDSLELDTDLEKMVEDKLGKDFTAQIKAELGGNISFKTLFSPESPTLTRGFFLSRMNSEHGTKEAVEKIAEIFQHYSEKEISNHSDLEKIVIFQNVCKEAKSELLGLDQKQVGQFSNIQTALEGKKNDYLSPVGLDPNQLYHELRIDALNRKIHAEHLRQESLREGGSGSISNPVFSESLTYSLGPILAGGNPGQQNDQVVEGSFLKFQPPLRHPPRKPVSKDNSDDPDCLTALGSVLNDFVKSLENIFSSNENKRGPKSTTYPREQENFLDAISALFCQGDGRK